MQAAKKLVLVDEFDREYKRLQRPAVDVAKAKHSVQLSNALHDTSLTDDLKVREYVDALHRYLNVDRRVPKEPKVGVNWSTDPQENAPTPPRQVHQPPPKKRRRKKTNIQWAQYGRSVH